MEILTTIINVLIMFFYMIPAYILVKTGKANTDHASTISSILLYITFPAMIINSFQPIEFSYNNLKQLMLFFVVTLILLAISIIICYLILKRKFSEPKYRMLSIASSLGNVGFFGTPLIRGLYPDSPIVECYSAIYSITVIMIGLTVGAYALTMDRKFISVFSALYNQATIGFLLGLIIYLAKWQFPKDLGNAVSSLSKMSTPLCMHILGIRLASVNFFDLFKKPFVYAICLLKLFIYPLFTYLIVYFIPGLDTEFKASIFVLSAAPCASIIISLSEMLKAEQELSANVFLVTTVLCIITLPLITIILDKTI